MEIETNLSNVSFRLSYFYYIYFPRDIQFQDKIKIDGIKGQGLMKFNIDKHGKINDFRISCDKEISFTLISAVCGQILCNNRNVVIWEKVEMPVIIPHFLPKEEETW